MKAKNTPEQIVTREKGAYFYCVACRLEYRKCKCVVYRSVDTLKGANHGVFGPANRFPV